MHKTLTWILAVAATGIVSLALYRVVPRTKEQAVETAISMAPAETKQTPDDSRPSRINPMPSSHSETAVAPPKQLVSKSKRRDMKQMPPVENQANVPSTEDQAFKVDPLVLKEIRFKGVKAFSSESVQALVSKFVGIPLAIEDLPEIAVAVENFYKQNNHLARVILTQQELTNGILTLDVMESALSKDKVETQLSELSNQREMETDQQVAITASNATPKEPVLKSEAAQQLHTQNHSNEADLILKMYKNHSRQSELIFDNLGETRYGAERVEGQFTWFNTWLPNDQLHLSALISKGSEFFKSNYKLPIGTSGWNLGLTASAMDYKVISGLPGDLGELGKVFAEAVEFSYPLSTSFNTKSELRLSAQAAQYTHVTAVGYSLSEYDTEVLVAEFSGVDRAFTPANGTLNYAIQWHMGQLNLANTTVSADADQGGSTTAGQFNKIRTHVSFMEPWSPTTDLYVGLTGQWADRNLTYAEKLQMGGALGIRAYPAGTGSATNGQMLNLELRRRLENGLLLTGFYDWGHVAEMINQDPASPSNWPNSYELKGYGLSAAYNFNNGTSVQATWARRDGNDPRSADTNTDHPTDRNRYWLQVRIPF